VCLKSDKIGCFTHGAVHSDRCSAITRQKSYVSVTTVVTHTRQKCFALRRFTCCVDTFYQQKRLFALRFISHKGTRRLTFVAPPSWSVLARCNMHYGWSEFRSCRGSAGQAPATHRRGFSLIPGQFMWNLWWETWNWDWFFLRVRLISLVAVISAKLFAHLRLSSTLYNLRKW